MRSSPNRRNCSIRHATIGSCTWRMSNRPRRSSRCSDHANVDCSTSYDALSPMRHANRVRKALPPAGVRLRLPGQVGEHRAIGWWRTAALEEPDVDSPGVERLGQISQPTLRPRGRCDRGRSTRWPPSFRRTRPPHPADAEAATGRIVAHRLTRWPRPSGPRRRRLRGIPARQPEVAEMEEFQAVLRVQFELLVRHRVGGSVNRCARCRRSQVRRRRIAESAT